MLLIDEGRVSFPYLIDVLVCWCVSSEFWASLLLVSNALVSCSRSCLADSCFRSLVKPVRRINEVSASNMLIFKEEAFHLIRLFRKFEDGLRRR